MDKGKRFVKTVLTYFAGNVLSKLIVFFLLPLYTVYLIPEQYGEYDLVVSVINLIAPIAFFQIWDGMYRISFDYSKKEEKHAILNNALVVFLIGFLFYLLLFCGAALLLDIHNLPAVIVYGFGLCLHYYYTYSARVFLENTLLAVSGVINTLITALLNVILLTVWKWDVSALYWSVSAGMCVQILIMEARLKILPNFRRADIDGKVIRKMAEFSLPLCVTSVSYWLLSGYTKLIISESLGTYENGLYAVANRFATVISLLVTMVQFAWNELAYLMAKDENRMDSYTKCVNLMTRVVVWGSMGAIFFIKAIFPYYIGEAYQDAVWIIPAVLLGVAANALASFFATLFLTEKKTKSVMVTVCIAAGVNIIGGRTGAVYGGLQGALIALAVSFTLMLVLRLCILKRRYRVSLSVDSFLECAGIVFGVGMFYFIDRMSGLLLCTFLCLMIMLLRCKNELMGFVQRNRKKGLE